MARSARSLGRWLALTALLLGITTVPLARAEASDNPEGIPADAQEATVAGFNDGDKFEVRVDGKTEEVLLIGSDAPELTEGDFGECYAQESADRVEELLAKGDTVYLEMDKDETDSKDRLLRYVWVAPEGEDAYMLNERLIVEGFNSFKPREDNSYHDDVLEAAQDEAQSKNIGLWKECGEAHVELKPTPTEPPDKADAQYIDPRLLGSDPDAHEGELVLVQGLAGNIEQHDDYTWVYFVAQSRTTSAGEDMVVELRPKDGELLTGTCYRFYGVASGTQEAENLDTGNGIELPFVKAFAVEESPGDGLDGMGYYQCDAP